MQLWALVTFCLATVLLIPFESWIWGGLAFAASVSLTLLTRDPTFQRRMLVLLGCILMLALAPISTETSNLKFLTLGLPFLAVIALPPLLLRKSDPGLLQFRMFPEKFSKLEFAYTVLSIPLAYFAFQLYFTISPEVPFNWKLPPEPDNESLLRLFTGINLVGIWDELFFVNTSFAILRSLFPFWKANWAQSVVYVSVLFDMAFTGYGPLFVLFLAVTQGIMFERSKALIYVLAVHLIVDYFLFQAIVDAYYPGFKTWWHP
ncbi:CPBP family glutamic-type intramembrane protease [Deinococcus misasensis]|uniref:CPBP family glutamic-type intramembrane protease n=1 Tax=Deinococcus misasensis TaxID=392413 RepID=UPI00068BED9E|nr:CPBP family glutamic-type intramembrane protease [Deinococcus misasensis]